MAYTINPHKMKVLWLTLALLFITANVYAAWTYNPFTKKLDFHSGVSKVAYDASPTTTTLRDALISAGIMDAAPPVVSATYIKWTDRTDMKWTDRGTMKWQDRLN
jgi:hypothetical protein